MIEFGRSRTYLRSLADDGSVDLGEAMGFPNREAAERFIYKSDWLLTVGTPVPCRRLADGFRYRVTP